MGRRRRGRHSQRAKGQFRLRPGLAYHAPVGGPATENEGGGVAGGCLQRSGEERKQTGLGKSDACLAVRLGDGGLLAGVFDGHGENGGIIARAIRDLVAQLAPELFGGDTGHSGDSLPDVFRRLFHVAHQGVVRGGLGDLSGTTATIVLIDTARGVLSYAHVGDSRLIVSSVDSVRVLCETTDHDVDGEEGRRILAAGGEVRERLVSGIAARRVFVPGQDFPGLAMSRALGDVQAHQLGVTADPTVAVDVPLPPGSAVTIGSDGIWDMLSAGEAAALVAAEVESGTGAAAAALVAEARGRWLRRGGYVDDVSAVVVFLPGHQPQK